MVVLVWSECSFASCFSSITSLIFCRQTRPCEQPSWLYWEIMDSLANESTTSDVRIELSSGACFDHRVNFMLYIVPWDQTSTFVFATHSPGKFVTLSARLLDSITIWSQAPLEDILETKLREVCSVFVCRPINVEVSSVDILLR